MWWCFHENQLDDQLAAREAKRRQDGATEQQAKDETFTIKEFLVSIVKRFGGSD